MYIILFFCFIFVCCLKEFTTEFDLIPFKFQLLHFNISLIILCLLSCLLNINKICNGIRHFKFMFILLLACSLFNNNYLLYLCFLLMAFTTLNKISIYSILKMSAFIFLCILLFVGIFTVCKQDFGLTYSPKTTRIVYDLGFRNINIYSLYVLQFCFLLYFIMQPRNKRKIVIYYIISLPLMLGAYYLTCARTAFYCILIMLACEFIPNNIRKWCQRHSSTILAIYTVTIITMPTIFYSSTLDHILSKRLHHARLALQLLEIKNIIFGMPSNDFYKLLQDNSLIIDNALLALLYTKGAIACIMAILMLKYIISVKKILSIIYFPLIISIIIGSLFESYAIRHIPIFLLFCVYVKLKYKYESNKDNHKSLCMYSCLRGGKIY